nr:hemocyanin-like 1 (Hcl-1) gene [Biomphalaria glabrata]
MMGASSMSDIHATKKKKARLQKHLKSRFPVTSSPVTSSLVTSSPVISSPVTSSPVTSSPVISSPGHFIPRSLHPLVISGMK